MSGDAAAEVIRRCREQWLTLATAESLTGGLVCAALTAAPGASAVVRGGVVAYATERKHAVLGVPAELLAERGAVDADVALAMARGACSVLAADVAIATTGVAGPEPQDGKPVGTVFVAVCGGAPGEPTVERVTELSLNGERAQIRSQTVTAALDLCLEVLAG